MLSQSFVLYFRMEFIYVISKTEQNKFSFYVAFTTCQKPIEFIVAFQNAKSSFHLYRPVDSQMDSLIGCYVLIRFSAFFYKCHFPASLIRSLTLPFSRQMYTCWHLPRFCPIDKCILKPDFSGSIETHHLLIKQIVHNII